MRRVLRLTGAAVVGSLLSVLAAGAALAGDTALEADANLTLDLGLGLGRGTGVAADADLDVDLGLGGDKAQADADVAVDADVTVTTEVLVKSDVEVTADTAVNLAPRADTTTDLTADVTVNVQLLKKPVVDAVVDLAAHVDLDSRLGAPKEVVPTTDADVGVDVDLFARLSVFGIHPIDLRDAPLVDLLVDADADADATLKLLGLKGGVDADACIGLAIFGTARGCPAALPPDDGNGPGPGRGPGPGDQAPAEETPGGDGGDGGVAPAEETATPGTGALPDTAMSPYSDGLVPLGLVLLAAAHAAVTRRRRADRLAH